MSEVNNLMELFPEWVTEEKLQRVLSHYDDKGEVFAFDLPHEELCDYKRNTVYHVVPHYAEDGAEDIIDKLRRIMSGELPKD